MARDRALWKIVATVWQLHHTCDSASEYRSQCAVVHHAGMVSRQLRLLPHAMACTSCALHLHDVSSYAWLHGNTLAASYHDNHASCLLRNECNAAGVARFFIMLTCMHHQCVITSYWHRHHGTAWPQISGCLTPRTQGLHGTAATVPIQNAHHIIVYTSHATDSTGIVGTHSTQFPTSDPPF